MLEHFHAIEHPLLLLRRHGAEVLQTVSELLLALLRKLTEVLILFESSLLLLGRKAHGVAQPVSVVRALSADDLARHCRWGRWASGFGRCWRDGARGERRLAASQGLLPGSSCGMRCASGTPVLTGPEGSNQGQGKQ